LNFENPIFPARYSLRDGLLCYGKMTVPGDASIRVLHRIPV